MASDLTPIEGIVHECKTSFDVISMRVGVILGMISLLLVISVRIFIELIIDDEKVSLFKIFE